MTDVATGEVLWRRLGERLWAATRDGYTFGTIEQGARFVASDGEGTVIGGFRSLDAAMKALEGGGDARSTRDKVATRGGSIVAGFSSGFGIGAVVLVGWALTSGLL